MTYVVMAHVIMACRVMARIGMTYIGMAHIATAYVVMAPEAEDSIAHAKPVYGYGLHRHVVLSYGLRC